MARKLFTISGWLVATVMALGGLAHAFTQSSFPRGAFVVGNDGSRWVVADGARYRMAFVTDDSNVLSSLRDGPTVASVDEAVSAISGSAPVAAQPAPATNPAQTLVGQQATVCSYGVELTVAVTRAEWTKSVTGVDAPGTSMWVVAFIDVTNQGTAREGLYYGATAKVEDDRGRSFDWASYPPDPNDVARAFGVKLAASPFLPGITEQSLMTFTIPGDSRSLTLVGKRLGAGC